MTAKVRCAIYTRKSSEEGLEQDFNSLHAQREACAAYVLSQASESWSLLPDEYDDGGLSGGTLERPALQRLLQDIAAGRIDIVVVYKVDRLTRSLLDFAKLVEAMDTAGVSFVSVTQSFNTTSSMGRLTLNMLLSFAQFEREVTAERIRDKIAASKAKGMWMGGIPPLGYEPDGRTLRVDGEHAAVIRDVFARYLALGNVRLLAEQMQEAGITVPVRTLATGRMIGGGVFTRGQIYRILSNPIYLGEVHHNGKVYDGRHEAIIDRETWDRTQTKLADNRQGTERSGRGTSPSLLAGLVVDGHGKPLVASHACKGKVRYRYYVSRALQHEADTAQSGYRIPALELEKVISSGLARQLGQPLALIELAGLKSSPEQMRQLAGKAQTLADRLTARERVLVRQLVAQVQVTQDAVTLVLAADALADGLDLDLPDGASTTFPVTISASLRRSGRAMRLVQDDGHSAGPSEVQLHLVRLLHRAQSWWAEMNARGLTPAAIGREHGVTSSYASRLIRLNFLAPDIVQAIVLGTQPPAVTAKTLLNLHDLPLDWSAQKALLHME